MTEVGGLLMRLERQLATLSYAVAAVARAAPAAWRDAALAWDAVAAPVAGRPPFGTQLLVIAGTLAGCIAVTALLRRLTASWRQHCAADRVRPRGVALCLAIELLDRALLFALAYAAMQSWFAADTPRDRLAVAVLWAAVRWWLLMLIVGAVLRPHASSLRLVALGDAAVRVLLVYAAALLGLGVAGISLMPLLLGVGLPIPSGQVIALAMGAALGVGAALGLLHVRRLERAAAAGAIAGLLWLALALAAGLWLVWSLDVLLLDFAVFHGLVGSIGLVALVYFADRAARQPAGAQLVIRRIVRAVLGAIVAYLVVGQWLVTIFELVSAADWARWRPSLITACAALLVGYAGWEALRDWAAATLAPYARSNLPGEDDAAIAPTSRLATAAPLLRMLLGSAIVVAAVLVALSEFGVNVGPLIAGAGIFGLAISFGSQALVRDIVSGVFFMIDDAFRIGEYIDTGRLKGTVEKISVRSLQLRHQNGQIHTIPFGQIASTTNFSRDWSTIKFNLRLARDTDMETVRKTIKRVGEEMLQDPELGPEFLMPLKLQGIAEVADNALVCRVKFTARPVNPTGVQRQALKRIHERFKDKGIEFASNAVTVQTAGPPLAAAAAAASAEAGQPMSGAAQSGG